MEKRNISGAAIERRALDLTEKINSLIIEAQNEFGGSEYVSFRIFPFREFPYKVQVATDYENTIRIP